MSLRGFNPKGRPPVTKSKAQMIHDSMTSLEQWCALLMTDMRAAIDQGGARDVAGNIPQGQDVFSYTQIQHWLPDALIKTTPSALGKALRRVGAITREPVKAGGKTIRLVAIRNTDHWKRNIDDAASWAANYERKLVTMRDRRGRVREKSGSGDTKLGRKGE